MKGTNMKKIVIAIVMAASMLTLSGCAWWESAVKDFESDTKKLYRTVEVYDYEGNLLKTYEGEMRIESESSQSCSFIIDGERTTIYGGIIVTQEIA